MAREKLNRWGEPEETEPTLHIDEWFPSEKSHQSAGMEQFSRAYVPIGIALGLILGLASVAVLNFAFRDGQINAVGAIVGGALGAWSLTFLVPYGTLIYYFIKKQVLISRRDRGLPVDIVPEDIDEYSLPLYMVPGFARLMMAPLNSGNKTMPLGMRRARVATFVIAGLFFALTILLTLISMASR